MKRAALHNLGCKVNAYETDAMTRQFAEAGYEIVPFAEEADVYVVNTCTVTNIADRKSRQMLHRAKQRNPHAVVAAVGCYVQADRARVEADPAVDLVIGNNQKGHIVELVEACSARRSMVIDINKTKEYEETPISSTAGHTRAYIKIQDGCNQFCSYCLIPYVRGRVRSRQPEDILAEARRLSDNGFQEIVLTGIHISSYGTDFPDADASALAHLICKLHEIVGIQRIRLGSLEPRVITPEFVETLAALPKVCPHFHLSLQSGCDSVLQRMNRHYTTAQYAESCRLLRTHFQNPAITTDVIVGFPGETEEEFETTAAYLQRLSLYEIHVFKYSRRKGTAADRMTAQVPEEQKAVRSERLLSLTAQCAYAFRMQWSGQRAMVLFEEETTVDGRRYFSGHTREYIRVLAPAAGSLMNRIVPVVMGEVSHEGFVYGKICL